MIGTIRTFDEAMRDEIHKRIRTTATNIAAAAGATAEVEIDKPYTVLVNDPVLTESMLPTLQRVAGEENLILRDKTTGYEDFAFFAQRAPGMFVFLGGSPPGTDLSKVAYNHSPRGTGGAHADPFDAGLHGDECEVMTGSRLRSEPLVS
jgi:amidohydrolase